MERIFALTEFIYIIKKLNNNFMQNLIIVFLLLCFNSMFSQESKFIEWKKGRANRIEFNLISKVQIPDLSKSTAEKFKNFKIRINFGVETFEIFILDKKTDSLVWANLPFGPLDFKTEFKYSTEAGSVKYTETFIYKGSIGGGETEINIEFNEQLIGGSISTGTVGHLFWSNILPKDSGGGWEIIIAHEVPKK
ncbi:MAG: hypothetical protein JNM67_07975 [Bacteroidetes bacterium]|nr:hypothetical protein [Bacteroidota bacterium]